MFIKKTIYIHIDIKQIISHDNLTRSSSLQEIKEAVEAYVAGLDYCEYNSINEDDITNICIAIWKSMRSFLTQEKEEEEDDIDDADIAMRESLGNNWW